MATTSVWPIRTRCVEKTKKESLEAIMAYVSDRVKTINGAVYREKQLDMSQVDIKMLIDTSMTYAPADVINDELLQQEYEKYLANEQAYAIGNVTDYAVDEEKTTDEEEQFVSGINCIPQLAVDEFYITKKRWGKTEGRVGYHGYQSFKPGEVTPALAHEIGKALAQEMWPGFEVVVATHLNKDHIHNHFVVNSVCAADGHKYDNNKADYRRMRQLSDDLCRAYGLSVIDKPERSSKRRDYIRYSVNNLIRADIDMLIHSERVTDIVSFKLELIKLGYKVRPGENKYFSVVPPQTSKAIRIDKECNLGAEYSLSSIERRILLRECTVPDGSLKEPVKNVQAPQPVYHHKKYSRIRIMYYMYDRNLSRVRGANIPTERQLRYVMRRDLAWLDKIKEERNLVNRYKVTTTTELDELRKSLKREIESLRSQKRTNSNEIRRRNATPENKAELKKANGYINGRIKKLEREVYLTGDIAKRIPVMENKFSNSRDKAKEYNIEKER